MRAVLLGALIALGSVEAHPREDLTVDTFAAAARTATTKYRDRNAAIADGYRQIGDDFPAMGAHWVHLALLFDGKIDVERPEFLNYVFAAGKPQLVGVAYALPLLAGESPPKWPTGREVWHDHLRTLEDETALPEHHAAGHTGHAPRISMLHAWIWLPNPAGLFAADNWAIPYFRLGLEPPKESREPAAKALSLASGFSDYFLASIDAAAPLKAGERKNVNAALARSSVAVTSLIRGQAALTPSQLDQLSVTWNDLWKTIDASVRSSSRPLIKALPVR